MHIYIMDGWKYFKNQGVSISAKVFSTLHNYYPTHIDRPLQRAVPLGPIRLLYDRMIDCCHRN